jgi:glucuronosyltransferase
MAKLQESKFDVTLSDAVGPCGELIAELHQIPFLYSLGFSLANNLKNTVEDFLSLPLMYL